MSLGTESVPFTMPVQPANTSGNSNGFGFGGDGAWWLIVLFLFVFCGWGNGGWGGNGGGSATQGALTRGDLCMDMNFNDLQNGVRNINDAVNLGFANLNSTICHQQYDTAMQTNAIQSAVNGGFQTLNSTICQQQYDTAQQLNAMNMANMQNANAANVVALQNANALQTQLADCCCQNRQGQAEINYNMATQACDTRNTIQNAARDIIDNANCNARAVLQKLNEQELAAKDAQITSLQNALNRCDTQNIANAAVQSAVAQVRPIPTPSWIVPNPFSGYGYQNYSCGCGCGCNG